MARPYRVTVSGGGRKGVLLSKTDNTTRLFDTLPQGLRGQALVSNGYGNTPSWKGIVNLPTGETGDVLVWGDTGYEWVNLDVLRNNLILTALAAEVIIAGQPVYHLVSEKVGIARADTLTKSRVAGIALTDALIDETVAYVSHGYIKINSWSLIEGSCYYLSPTGGITITKPVTIGQVVVNLGVAAGSKVLEVSIQPTILL